MLDQTRIDALRDAPVPPATHLIDGEPRNASDGATMEVISPLDGQVLTTIPAGTKSDVDDAVTAARRAFDDGRWSE